MTKKRFITFCLLLFCNTTLLFAQSVGVVLSGGGSRGAAHVGVLKALEENNIPIDYITGTSIGAIVGGLYASGYTISDIEILLASKEFQRWATGEQSSQQTYFFREYQKHLSWIQFKFDITKKGIDYKLPTSLFSSNEISYNILELFTKAQLAANNDFDSLFIPFRCVASDIDSNKAYVLSEGDLGKSILASMSFPFVFKPVNINGKILLDGGMYNNFPIDIMMETWQPDVIIGSQVAGNYGTPNADDAILMVQNMLMNSTSYDVPSDMGVLIKPKVAKLALTDFSQTLPFIDSGYIATMREIPKIKQLVDRRCDSTTREAKRDLFLKKMPKLKVDKIIITNDTNKKREKMLTNRLSVGLDTLTIKKAKERYMYLAYDAKIENIEPSFLYDDSVHQNTLSLTLNYTPHIDLRVGGIISSNTVNQFYLGISGYTWANVANTTSLDMTVGTFFNSLSLSNQIEFYANRPFFINFSIQYYNKNYNNSNAFFYDNDAPNFLQTYNTFFNLNITTPIHRKGIFETGLSIGNYSSRYYQTNSFSSLDTTDQTRYYNLNPYIKMEFNTLNRPVFASKGGRVSIKVAGFFGDEKYIPGSTSIPGATEESYSRNWVKICGDFNKYFPISDFFSLGIESSICYSNQPLFNNYRASVWIANNFEPTPWSSTYYLPNYRASSFFTFGITPVFSPFKNLDIHLGGYYFQPYKKIIRAQNLVLPAYGEPFSHHSIMADAIIVYNTIIGPITLGAYYFDREQNKFLGIFSIGFLLFPQGSMP